MSKELQIKAQVIYTPSSGSGQIGVDSGLLEKLIDMTGDDFKVGTQVIADSEEVIDLVSDIATLGYVLIKNLHSSNTVKVGFADVSTADDARPILIEAGEFALFRANGSLYAVASAASTKIQIYAFED